jgi:hypothetical protein
MRQQLRQPDRGARGPNKKGLLSGHIYSKKESWKIALSLTEKGQKAACEIKGTMDKKKKRTAYSNSG